MHQTESESGLSFRAKPVPLAPSKAESSKCFILNTDFYSPITFSHSHLPLFPTFSSVSPSLPSSFSLADSSAACLELNFCLAKAKSSVARAQCCDSPHGARPRAMCLVLLENSCRSLWFSLSCPHKGSRLGCSPFSNK